MTTSDDARRASPKTKAGTREIAYCTPMPLALPQSYSTGFVIRIPKQLSTVGDHIRKRRLGLKMLQREVAEKIGVDKTNVRNWEGNASSPEIRHMPAIIGFLGCDPLPAAKTMGQRLVRHRTRLGQSQEEAARELGVDPGTLAGWERGERELAGRFLNCVERFLREGGNIGRLAVGIALPA